MPHESVKDLVGRPLGIVPCANGKFDGGTRQVNGGLGSLIVARSQGLLLYKRGKKSGWGTSPVQETGEGRAIADHHGRRYRGWKLGRRREEVVTERSYRPSVLDWVQNNGRSLYVAIR